ncbi:MAG: DNA-formamidopyrimidine glycosylase family protein [Planctomycetota bacterium]
MPEGHKTHFLAKRHREFFSEQALRVTSPQGRFRGDARKVSGKILEHVEAVGKHLFYRFEGGRYVHVHLGRYGKFREHDAPPPKPVGKVRMRLVGSDYALDLNGPTTCRVIDESVREEVLRKLGPDPLAGGKKRDVWEIVRVSQKPIGALLLDQSVIAGVGNIFRAELLFELGLNPNTRGNELDPATFDRLWRSLGKMMRTGLKYGKIITVTAKEAGAPLATLEGGQRFRVYGKEVCPECTDAVRTDEIAARKLYWCPQCQPAARVRPHGR